MITSLEGKLVGTGLDWADVSIGGITLRAFVPESSVDTLGSLGELVLLYTSLQVREDSLTLYGFPTNEARTTFDALITVNGVGPRLALGILSMLSPDSLAVAIAAGDPQAFKGVSGVGTKTANRIMMEMKGKLDVKGGVELSSQSNTDLIDALTAIGYTVPEIMSAIAELPHFDSASLEDKVRSTIEYMESN